MRLDRALPVLLVLVSAGCFDRGQAPEEADGAAAPLSVEGAAVNAEGVPLLPARFPLPEAVDATHWENGTFRIEQHGRVGPGPRLPVSAADGIVEIDITHMVPRDVPVRIIGEVNAEVGRGDVDLWLQTPPGEWRTGNWNSPFGGYTRFEVGMVHVSSEPIVAVLAYDEIDEQQEFPYVLSVRVVADPTLLVNGIATGVTLPAAAQVSVELVGAPRERELFDAVSLMVFSPTDEYLGAFPVGDGVTPIALPADAPAGEYVMMLSQGGRNARLLVAGEEAVLRAVGQAFVVGDVHVGEAPGRVAWTTQHDRVPLLVGVEFRAPNFAQDAAVTIAGPHGPVVQGTIEGRWIGFRAGEEDFGSYFGWDSGFGAPGLAAGTYEAEVTFATAAGAEHVEAVDFAAFHVR